MISNNRQFVTGAEAAVQGALDAGAEMMYGYPITPATEVFTIWIKKGQKYLQTEDEIAAGFGVCGAVIAGQKAFTCSAGPGHILMQDAISMAEGMRLPFVAVIGQRGGPSSGTVIYSQQEVILSCFGGNGEGHRLVYSPSNLDELYRLTALAFHEAWQYKFPAIVLTDGYLLKTKGILDETKAEPAKAHPLINEETFRHWRNIYNFEEELRDEVLKMENDFAAAAKEAARAEEVQTDDVEILLVAHGIVGAAAKEAVDILRGQGIKVGLFRPITLRPLAKEKLDKAAAKAKKIIVIESSLGQLARLVRDQLAPEISTPFDYLQKPAVGIEVEEIVNFVYGI
ncbi:ferredoxin oxidoreductase [Patescibacteria group bacterium]|nr:MAG: ferredoxin oxidoreductase [Patescibacteria group bacterium]